MKIALYVPSWPPGYAANGIVTYASQLVPALRRLGHDVFVLTPFKEAEDNDPYTVDLRRFAPTRTFWDRAMFKLAPETMAFKTACATIAAAIRALAAEHQLDVFEMEESFGLSHAVSSLNMLPVVVRLHGPWFLNGSFDEPTNSDTIRQRREGRGIRHAQFVTSPSAEVLKAVKIHYGIDLPTSRVISNPLEAASESDIWNLDSCDRNSLLFVGRFDRRKGGDLVLRAFAELAACNHTLRLTFVGPDAGIPGGNEILHFDQFVRHNLPERCWPQIEYRGQLTHSDVMSLRTKHFATIVASQYEPFPYSVLEAMSRGCPLVATAVGGIPELVKDQQNGLLVSPDTVKTMADACQKLLDNEALAARVGRQAWRDCRDIYGPQNIAKQTVAAYQEAIDIFRLSKTT